MFLADCQDRSGRERGPSKSKTIARISYVMVGCHFQKIRPSDGDHIRYVLDSLQTALSDWKRKLATELQLSDNAKRTIEQTIKNVEAEIRAVGGVEC